LSKLNTNEIFEIQDSSVNIQEIMDEIESKLKDQNIDLDEINRISGFSARILTEKNKSSFDPAFTANLFEKGISPPKFTNPALWFMRGPLRWLAIKFIEFYSLFDKKVSDNRIKAFYAVIIELVTLKNKHDKLAERFDELYKDYIDLKSRIIQQPLRQVPLEFDSTMVNIIRKSNTRILNLISVNQKTIILYPEHDLLLMEMELSENPFFCLTEDIEQYKFLKKNITGNIEHINSIINFTNYKEYKNIVFSSNACLFPGWTIQKIIYNILKHADPETKIFLKYSNSSLSFHSPFQDVYRTKIIPELLIHNLREMGFKNAVNHTVDEDEYNLITFQKS
jgi:hypothetical protein